MRLRLPPRMTIYRSDSAAEWVFAVSEGVVKSYRELPSGKRVVGAFLFARDLFGLSGERPIHELRAVDYARHAVPASVGRADGAFEARCQPAVPVSGEGDARIAGSAAPRHSDQQARRRRAPRDVPGENGSEHRDPTAKSNEIPLPMTRSDIAGFLGLSLETVSRAAAELERRRLVKFENRHLARILDAPRLAKLVSAV